MQEKTSAHSIVAFAVVELNTPLPYDVLCDMSPTDGLYAALIKAWREKELRLDRRTALLCTVIANVQGNKTKIEDFVPSLPKTSEEKEEELKANLIAFSSTFGGN